MTAALVVSERGPMVGLDPSQALAIRDALQAMSARVGRRAVIVCREKLRPALARFVESAGVAATVLGVHEIAPGYALSIEETVSL
jgi:flagellar biosynthesis component FlhA